MIAFKPLSLAVVLVLGAWALVPPPAQTTGRTGAEAGASRVSGPRKYTIRIVPGFYMPGRQLNPGDRPMQALRDVGDDFERKFPDTKVEFVDAPVGQREWIVTQLTGGTAPDIINVNVEDVWQDVQKGWYVPLDSYLEAPNPFVAPGKPGSRQWWDMFRYQAISRSKAAPDGRMYCITLDMIETGLFYNKKLFAEAGVKPPKDWQDYLRIQRVLKDRGVTPTLVGPSALADWGFDLMFDQVYRDIRPTLDVKKDAKRDVFYKGYLDWDEIAFLNRKGFFGASDPRWREVFRLLKQWRQFMPKDIGNVDMQREFIQGKAAMVWDSSLFVQKLDRDPRRDFEWGMFYLPPITKATSRYAGGHDQCIIGEAATQFVVTRSAINDTEDAATSEKLKRCVAFLQFATTKENCNRVVNEVTALMPNVRDVPDRPELAAFVNNLRRPYTTTKWVYTFDLRFSEVVNRMLYLYLMDGATEDEFIDWMNRNVRIACDNVVRRKRLDLAPLEVEWNRLASLRPGMADLPPEARR